MSGSVFFNHTVFRSTDSLPLQFVLPGLTTAIRIQPHCHTNVSFTCCCFHRQHETNDRWTTQQKERIL